MNRPDTRVEEDGVVSVYVRQRHLDASRPVEWPHDLDVVGLQRAGWRPRPFRQFILKVHSRCNLACDYCYVYRSVDQTWRDQPARMAGATAARVAERIAEHVEAHALDHVGIVLHGGEPLLAGGRFLAFLAATLRAALPAGTQLDLEVQTNATLIDAEMLLTLDQEDIRVGVSLDGGVGTHDTHRRYADGRGSYRDVSRGLALLRSPRYRHLFAGLLCVVDPRTDPVATYEDLLAHDPPVVDFLLPHANWSSPPPYRPGSDVLSYGDWLVAAFDRWYGAARRETSVRLFDEIIRGLVGQPSRVESIGLAPAQHIVVETDGSIEQVDALKSAYEGAARTGYHVDRDPLDVVLLAPHVVARQIGVAALGPTCRRCDVRDVCGGGYFPHRYQQRSGFRNPSVYCDDLAVLIRHVHARVHADLEHSGLLVDRPPGR